MMFVSCCRCFAVDRLLVMMESTADSSCFVDRTMMIVVVAFVVDFVVVVVVVFCIVFEVMELVQSNPLICQR